MMSVKDSSEYDMFVNFSRVDSWDTDFRLGIFTSRESSCSTAHIFRSRRTDCNPPSSSIDVFH